MPMITTATEVGFCLLLTSILLFRVGPRAVWTAWTLRKTLYSALLLTFFSGTWFLAHRAAVFVSRMQAEKLLGYAPSYAWTLEQMGHSQISVNTPANDPLYLKLIEFQKGWLKANPFVADIYTISKNGNKHVLLVDSETDYDADGRYDADREVRTTIGELYEKEIPELQNAFLDKKGFTVEPYEDRWGNWVSAFVPLHSSDGRVNAVLGLDFPAQTYLAELHTARAVVWIGSALLFLIFLNFFIAKHRQEQYQENLRMALQKAESAAVVKARFLANMSHEIRTPLNGILGIVDLVSDLPKGSDIRPQLELIRNCGDSLLAVINDVLDFSKIESGKIILDPISFHFEQMVEEAISVLALGAEKKGLKLEFVRLNPELGWITADSTRIRQILFNLISNAIKFTAEGSVSISINTNDVASSGELKQIRVEVKVRDTGIGMTEADQKKLFQSFSQVDASTTRQFGGTGLGLAICKGLAEAMGGDIAVESARGRGTTFTVSFLAQRATMQAMNAPKQTEPTVHGEWAKDLPLQILVVDDHPTNRLLAERFLEKLGYPVDTATNGVEAVSSVEKKHYDVVFMDCQMPEMDGFAATAEIHRLLPLGKRPWIIALTANAFAEDRAECLKAGMDDFVAKPFSLQTLADALKKSKTSTSSAARMNLPASPNSVFDLNLMRQHFHHEFDIMEFLVADFIASYDDVFNDLRLAVEANDCALVRMRAHKLRGNIANFFAAELQAHLLKLETNAKEDNLEDAKEQLHLIYQQLQKLHRELLTIKREAA